MGPIVAITPFKGTKNSKSRLKSLLTEKQRIEISLMMLGHVLNTVAKCTGISGRILVGGDRISWKLAVSQGFDILPDNEPGLNVNLKRALQLAASGGYEKALILPTDLPFITVKEIDEMIRFGTSSDAVVVPAKEGTGTNGLLIPLKADFKPKFGFNSFTEHVEELCSMNLKVGIYDSNLFSCDLDTPMDWNSWGCNLLNSR